MLNNTGYLYYSDSYGHHIVTAFSLNHIIFHKLNEVKWHMYWLGMQTLFYCIMGATKTHYTERRKKTKNTSRCKGTDYGGFLFNAQVSLFHY